MANIKQQKKRIGQDRRRRLRNMDVKSRMRTFIKRAMTALNAGDKAAAGVAVPEAVTAIDRAVAKGVIHRNAGARKKSSLVTRINALQ